MRSAKSWAAKYVEIYTFPDGRLEVPSLGHVLPYRVFDKDQRVNPAAIVERKRLSHARIASAGANRSSQKVAVLNRSMQHWHGVFTSRILRRLLAKPLSPAERILRMSHLIAQGNPRCMELHPRIGRLRSWAHLTPKRPRIVFGKVTDDLVCQIVSENTTQVSTQPKTCRFMH
jgi:hypothetical protein